MPISASPASACPASGRCEPEQRAGWRRLRLLGRGFWRHFGGRFRSRRDLGHHGFSTRRRELRERGRAMRRRGAGIRRRRRNDAGVHRGRRNVDRRAEEVAAAAAARRPSALRSWPGPCRRRGCSARRPRSWRTRRRPHRSPPRLPPGARTCAVACSCSGVSENGGRRKALGLELGRGQAVRARETAKGRPGRFASSPAEKKVLVQLLVLLVPRVLHGAVSLLPDEERAGGVRREPDRDQARAEAWAGTEA